jgi:hypothetical protein
MQEYGIEIDVKNKPELDPDFFPLYKFQKAFLSSASKPFSFALERNDKQIAVVHTKIHCDMEHAEADRFYIERLVKILMWQKGGFRLYVKGDDSICQMLKDAYSENGTRSFDAKIMAEMYQHDFEVIKTNELPEEYEISKSIGRHFDGCRIGFDAGGSDYKVSAVIDGEVVHSKETVWHPKENSDPEYHFRGIVSAFKEAAEYLPHIDSIGISSAGIIANNYLLMAQLFQKVSKEDFDRKGRDIYIRAVKEIGESIPFEVANDGDVTALTGSISLERNNLLGIAMGTSVAGGFVDKEGNIAGWLNEIAFLPVDGSPKAAVDVWSGDLGVAVHYFCQEAVIKLAKVAGIPLDDFETPAQKLSAVQKLLEEKSSDAAAIFRSIGSYLGHTAPLYNEIYGADAILLLGRVMSGEGGNLILETANKVLAEEYQDIHMDLILPDEKTRRMGQSVIAASLPEIKK